MRRIVIAGIVTSLALAVAKAEAATIVIEAADERMFDIPEPTPESYRGRRVRDWEQRERPKHRKRKRHGR